MDAAALYDALWRNALGVIPLVLAIAILCRLAPLRAATRHTLWTVALLSLFIPPVIPRLNVDSWFASAPITVAEKDLAALPVDRKPIAAPAITPDPLAHLRAAPLKETSALTTKPASIGWGKTPNDHNRETNRSSRSTTERASTTTEKSSTYVKTKSTNAKPQKQASKPSSPASNANDLKPLVVTAPKAEYTAPITDPAPLNYAKSLLQKTEKLSENRTHESAPVREYAPATTPLLSLARSTVAPLFERETYAPWIAEAKILRDSILALPPVPVVIWVGGAAIIALIAAVRIAMHRRLLTRSLPASVRVQMMVDDCADAFGIRRSPTTYMVLDRVSPMIWCGLSPKLILPIELWRELDDAGRRAVVHHELAHLKRRDHWLRWAELAVGCVYWWHPMVWWVRKKIREEADNCCDAWVTALLPTERRAYATALLRTKAYLNETTTTPGPVGLGVTTATAKRFARRLTMVMTHRTKPHLSMTGLLIAATFATVASIATPIWACPPDHHKKSAEEHAAMHAPKAPKAEKAPKAAKAPKAEKAPKPDEADSTFERFMEGKEGNGDNLDARLRELEQRLNRAMQNVEGLIAAPEAPSPAAPPIAGLPPAYAGAMRAAQESNELIDKDYVLPKDKLEKLTVLMSRDDVPVLIIPGDDKITVRATKANHKIFGAFVSVINPTPGNEVFAISEGKLKDFSNLMVLGSVPIRVRPGDESITVYGSDLERKVVAAFAQMIDPDGFKAKGATSDDKNVSQNQMTAAPTMRHGIEAQANTAMNKARALAAEADRLEALRSEIEAKVSVVEAEAESIEDEADRVADEAEEMLERAEEIAEEAEHAEAADARYRKVAEAGSLRAEAEARRVSAKALLAQAEAVMRQAAVLEAQAEAMEHRADALREQVEEIEDSITDHLDSLEASLQDRYDKLYEIVRQQAHQIEQIIEQYENRLGQDIDGRLAQQLKQQLNVIDRAAEQRVVVRNAANN